MANELENTIETKKIAENAVKNDTPSGDTARVKELEAEIAKLKQSVTNASADASSWKKQFKEADEALKAKMSEEERAEKERAEAQAAMQTELETLRNERNIANFKAQFVSIGFDETLSQETAEAMNSGDTAKVFDGIRKFIATHDKEMAEKAIMNNPTLPGGSSTAPVVTKEQFDAMSLSERNAFYNEHPELYAEYTKR